MRILENVKHSLYKIVFLILMFNVEIAYALGGTSGTLQISTDGKFARLVIGGFISPWIDMKIGGKSQLSLLGGYDYYLLEIANKNIKITYLPVMSGGYTNKIASASLCEDGVAYHLYYSGNSLLGGVKIYIQNSSLKWCDISYTGRETCGGWIAFDKNYTCLSCPEGYTFNSSRNICEADPIINYTCPYTGQTCVEQSKGVAYCSPYNCNTSSSGVWCADGNIDTSNMNANTIGMYQCAYSSEWFIDFSSCKVGCNYFQCSMDGQWYQGDIVVCQNNCKEQGTCQELSQ